MRRSALIWLALAWASFTVLPWHISSGGWFGWLLGFTSAGLASALGLDSDSGGALTKLARDYLADWSKTNADGTTTVLEGTKSRRRLLRKRLDDAVKTTDRILAAYTAAGN